MYSLRNLCIRKILSSNICYEYANIPTELLWMIEEKRLLFQKSIYDQSADLRCFNKSIPSLSQEQSNDDRLGRIKMYCRLLKNPPNNEFIDQSIVNLIIFILRNELIHLDSLNDDYKLALKFQLVKMTILLKDHLHFICNQQQITNILSSLKLTIVNNCLYLQEKNVEDYYDNYRIIYKKILFKIK